MLYVSHRLEEVFAIADRITVMRNGRLSGPATARDLTMPDGRRGDGRHAARASCTRRAATVAAHAGRRAADPGLVGRRGLTVGDELRDATFAARRGEIIGLAGLEGSGRRDPAGRPVRHPTATAGEVRCPTAAGAPRHPPPRRDGAWRWCRPTGATRA